jgi:uncharacterized small protein (DUF1192 family)
VSQPERYEPRARRIGGPWKMVKCKDGPYVCHEQHAEIVAALAADKQAADRATFDAIRAFTVLKDENAALQAEVERLKAETVKQIEAALPPVEAYIAKLEAENERLRKAGDAMADELIKEFIHPPLFDAWQDAKEGR